MSFVKSDGLMSLNDAIELAKHDSREFTSVQASAFVAENSVAYYILTNTMLYMALDFGGNEAVSIVKSCFRNPSMGLLGTIRHYKAIAPLCFAQKSTLDPVFNALHAVIADEKQLYQLLSYGKRFSPTHCVEGRAEKTFWEVQSELSQLVVNPYSVIAQYVSHYAHLIYSDWAARLSLKLTADYFQTHIRLTHGTSLLRTCDGCTKLTRNKYEKLEWIQRAKFNGNFWSNYAVKTWVYTNYVGYGVGETTMTELAKLYPNIRVVVPNEDATSMWLSTSHYNLECEGFYDNQEGRKFVANGILVAKATSLNWDTIHWSACHLYYTSCCPVDPCIKVFTKQRVAGKERVWKMAAKLAGVPKNIDTDRLIGMEDPWQMSRQKVLQMEMLRKNASTKCIFTKHQRVNCALAYIGSKYGFIATIDSTRASDLISDAVQHDLFPASYMHLLDQVRTPFVIGDLAKDDIATQGLMGCATTFENECAWFLCLALAAKDMYEQGSERYPSYKSLTAEQWLDVQTSCELTDDELRSVKYLVTTHKPAIVGDDVALPVEYAETFMDVLHALGGSPNPDKSFWSGAFRESCGAEWYDGRDVSPAYYPRKPIGITLQEGKLNCAVDELQFTSDGQVELPIERLIALQKNLYVVSHSACDFLTAVVQTIVPEMTFSLPGTDCPDLWGPEESGPLGRYSPEGILRWKAECTPEEWEVLADGVPTLSGHLANERVGHYGPQVRYSWKYETESQAKLDLLGEYFLQRYLLEGPVMQPLIACDAIPGFDIPLPFEFEQFLGTISVGWGYTI